MLVLDVGQFLSGPVAAMRLADLGARVIKIELPETGDPSRGFGLSDCRIDGASSMFHTVNRNKASYCADLANPCQREKVKRLMAQADVVIENFRPGTMEGFGLGYDAVSALNPMVVYAHISGYGEPRSWVGKSEQDLLVQALSGLTWLNGPGDGKPIPFGLSVVDMFASAHAVQGILALLVRRQSANVGGRVDVSLLESALHLQFEVLTTYFNDDRRLPVRGRSHSAHAYLGAPYGIYETGDGFLALAMGSVPALGNLIGSLELQTVYADPQTWFMERDAIRGRIAERLKTRETAHWLSLLDAAGYWCAPVLDIVALNDHDGLRALEMVQETFPSDGCVIKTTRCPIRVDAQLLTSAKGGPRLGEHTDQIDMEFHLSPPYLNEPGARSSPPKGTVHSALDGLLVVDFSQFLSGPSASLRLADFGARVIKVERPQTGDLCRSLYVSDTSIHGESTLFHAINRNKESIIVDLKVPRELERVKQLLSKADIVIENFRPGVMQRLGLDYGSLRDINPSIIYASISGYGSQGPWSKKPGQDLLVQALSGLTWLNGDGGGPPVAFGLSITDMMAGEHLVQGILAACFRRQIDGKGRVVEVSLLESAIDLQLEVLTTFLNDKTKLPQRSRFNNAHPYLPAPYGIYETKDGYLALGVMALDELGSRLGCPELAACYPSPESWFTERDEISELIQRQLRRKATAEWLSALEPAGLACAPVLNWRELEAEPGFQELQMTQETLHDDGSTVLTTRCPIRIDGAPLCSAKRAPKLGEHTEAILAEFCGLPHSEVQAQ